MNTKFKYQLITLFFIIATVCFGFAFYALSWTEPGSSPPDGNVDVPVNIGATSQNKSGALGVQGIFRAYSNVYIDGSLGIDTTSPTEKLQINDGDIRILRGDVCTDNGLGTVICLSSLASAGGDITGVNAGTGLTGGGGGPGEVTLYADTNYLQRRVSSSCAAGSSIRAISSTGTVTCEPDDTGASGTVTSISAGTGITLTPNPITTTGSIAVNTSTIQARVSACPVGEAINSISATGTPTCLPAGGGGTPGGLDGYVQYNNGGAFGATNMYYNDVTGDYTISGADISMDGLLSAANLVSVYLNITDDAYLASSGIGNVRIGSTAAPTEKLDVAGNILASGTICDGFGNCLDTVGGSCSLGGLQTLASNSGQASTDGFILVTSTQRGMNLEGKIGVSSANTVVQNIYDLRADYIDWLRPSLMFVVPKDYYWEVAIPSSRMGGSPSDLNIYWIPFECTGGGGSGTLTGLGWERVSSTLSGSANTISCPAGKKVMGGGCNVGCGLEASYPSSDTAWYCRTGTGCGATMTLYAICANQ